jgi:transposase
VLPSGERLWEGRFPRTPPGFDAFRARCSSTAAVAIEATTPTWHFADAIAEAVGPLTIVDPWKTRLKAGYAAKTDRLDARRLADALRRESVVGIYYPPVAIRELRELCRFRHTLVRTRTMLLQRLRAVLLRQGVTIGASLTRRRGQVALEQLSLPGQARASVVGLQQLLRAVAEQLAAADATLHAEATADPVVQTLQRIRGIGPVIGLTVRAEVGEIARFPSPGHLASYAGLVPRVEASAGRIRYGRITKQGSPWLRWALVEAAIQGPRRPDAHGRRARRLALRKGALKARVAVARMLCEEIWRAWPRVG